MESQRAYGPPPFLFYFFAKVRAVVVSSSPPMVTPSPFPLRSRMVSGVHMGIMVRQSWWWQPCTPTGHDQARQAASVPDLHCTNLYRWRQQWHSGYDLL
ncbi:hypothetical protein CDL15_Pgr001188 [Punica granatum]|uniref:Uncharacterized protein n=1 Tax=Punica granatum TaxID=22663 RepID=A0A218WJR5_PUNGR|nr:hypothetical protein CDL15_Pgr001188 [Punica granatum]